MTLIPKIHIRRAESAEDYQSCQEVQRRAWGIADERYVVPVATMVGAQQHGGLVLGAWLDDGRVVGMSFGFLGRVDGRLGLYSQLTGVVPDYQHCGIGRRLKEAQRAFARESALECVAWAFDPLQAGNARLNLGRLGATATRYVDNMYGRRTDLLNTGTPTDRLIVEWETRPIERIAPPFEAVRDAPRLIVVDDRRIGGSPVDPTISVALLEIPENVGRLRTEDPALAAAWQEAVRQAFHDAFAAGFRAEGFVTGELDGTAHGFYLLRNLRSAR